MALDKNSEEYKKRLKALELGLITPEEFESLTGQPAPSQNEIENLGDGNQVAQGDNNQIAGDQAVSIKGDVNAEKANIQTGGVQHNYYGDAKPAPEVDADGVLKNYLEFVITENQKINLHGISDGKSEATFELEELYISLRTISKIRLTDEERQAWLMKEAAMLPGEEARLKERFEIESMTTVSVNRALNEFERLLVLGDPGCGKTTLLKYLATVYAQDLRTETKLVQARFELEETGYLPIFIELRKLGGWLSKAYPDNDFSDGPDDLLAAYRATLPADVTLSEDLLNDYLKSGKAVILLDGLDEVASMELRRRVARITEAFTRRYPDCRYVLSSRIAGFMGPAVVKEGYHQSIVRPFSQADVRNFLRNWHRLAAKADGSNESEQQEYAEQETAKLMGAMVDKPHIAELASSPLLLTVIALVHKSRPLPDRRAELYKEAVDVLIAKWDAGHGIQQRKIGGHIIDADKKRIILQEVALHMHETRREGQREIDYDALKEILVKQFLKMYGRNADIEQMVSGFIELIEERAGLLISRENKSR